ncbi:MAG: exodeoxyribonuclease VII large subunit [Oscillospiraceae bacterium]
MIFSVSQINGYLKQMMEADSLLSAVFVRGEISNYKQYPSGHHYFTLKDASGALRCVLFRREAGRLRFAPQNGMKVIAFGRISVFPPGRAISALLRRTDAGWSGGFVRRIRSAQGESCIQERTV